MGTYRHDDQADLPAQEAPPREGARLSKPDEDQERPARDRRATRQGAQEADSLERRPHPMAALDMLRSRLDFAALQSDSRSRIDPLLVLRYRRNGLDRNRYGISTGRRIGGAVVRNRIRRRLRHLLAAVGPSVERGWDVLVIARPAAVTATHVQLGEALARLMRQAGIMGGAKAGS